MVGLALLARPTLRVNFVTAGPLYRRTVPHAAKLVGQREVNDFHLSGHLLSFTFAKRPKRSSLGALTWTITQLITSRTVGNY